MTDWPGGSSWWQASDGKWYPPELHPGTRPAPTEPVARRGRAPGIVIAGIVVALVLTTSVAAIVLREDGGLRLTAPSKHINDPDQPAIETPDGFKVVGGDEAGFTMFVPDRFESFDLTADDIEDLIDAMGPDNPELAAMLEAAAPIVSQGGKLIAFDTTTYGTGFADNVNVIQQPALGDPTSPALERQLVAGFESLGATVLNTEVIDLPVNEALRIDYRLPLNLPDGTAIEASGRAVGLRAGQHAWNITFTTGPGTGDEDFDVMLDSFRVAD